MRVGQSHDFDEITLATYRDVPWNGPFYASEGFVERGTADDFLRAHGLPPEEPVMGRFGYPGPDGQEPVSSA